MVKFYANGAQFDSIGQINVNYKYIYYDKNYIYFLIDTTGLVYKFNTTTEETTVEQAINNSSLTTNSIIVYNEIIYGFEGETAKIYDSETALYIKDNINLVKARLDGSASQNFGGNNKQFLLKSQTGIIDYLINSDLSYITIHGNNRVSKFDKTNTLIYTNTIPDIDYCMHIDKVHEYTAKGLEEYYVIMGTLSSGGNNIILTKFNDTANCADCDTTTSSITGYFSNTTTLPISSDSRCNSTQTNNPNFVRYNLTNYDYLRRTYPDKVLTFKVKLKNIYNNRDILDVEIPIDKCKYTSGNHHFCLRLDSVAGTITVFVDGKVFKTVNIQPGKYIFQDIIQDSIGVGSTYFYNNIMLSKYLNQKNNYFIDGAKIKQFKLFNKSLTDDQVRFLAFNTIQMGDLIGSVPADQRNAIDSIDRQFKLSVPGNKSNSINIKIKNCNINSPIILDNLKDVIREKLKDVLPVNVNINDITFNQF